MKRTHREASLGLAALLTALTAFCGSQLLHAQTINPRATQWFKTGVAETDPQKKIQAYEQAIELEPLFVEALYNLGLVHMQLKDYKNARDYLYRALKANPANTNSKLKAQILQNLATVNRRLGNYKQSEADLREALRLAPDDKLRSRIIFELARLLHQMKQYDAALAELEEGRRLAPEMNSFFDNLIAIIKKERDSVRLYSEATAAYNRGDLEGAARLYKRLHALNPSYRDVETKISEVDSMLQARTQERLLSELYAQAMTLASQNNYSEAIALLQRILQRDPEFKDTAQRLQALQQKQQQQQSLEEIKAEYAKGMEALKRRNWTVAIIAFERVLALDPEYLDARAKLAEANRGLENQGTETIVSLYYSQAINAMNEQDLGAALAALEKVRLLNPNYRETRKLIAKIEKTLESRLDSKAPSNAYYEKLHSQVLADFEQENWMQAILNLEKLKALRPNDPEINRLLSEARASLQLATSRKNEENADKRRNALVYTGWALAAVIGLPILGVMVFSPGVRARYYFMRGKYLKAAQIYERMLLRHPERIKLYVLLAKIYLLTGRNDEKALRVFQMLLNLNLAAHMHQQIRTVLTDKYLTGSKAEPDAISVLESALKDERQKQNGNA